MDTKSDNTEELLRRLLAHFYEQSGGGLAWSYRDDTTIREVDSSGLEEALMPYLKKKA